MGGLRASGRPVTGAKNGITKNTNFDEFHEKITWIRDFRDSRKKEERLNNVISAGEVYID